MEFIFIEKLQNLIYFDSTMKIFKIFFDIETAAFFMFKKSNRKGSVK